MFERFCKKELAIDQLPDKLDRIAYVFDRALHSIDFSDAASLLSYIAERSKYKDEIPTTEEGIRNYIDSVIGGVYRRIFKKQTGVFDGVSDGDLKEKLYPRVKLYFTKADDKLVVKREGKMGTAGMDPFLAELYGVISDSKITLTTQNNPVSVDVDVEIDPKLDALDLSLHPNDAKVLFSWTRIPNEFNHNVYRGKYNIESVTKAPEKPSEVVADKDISLERLGNRLRN